MAQAHGAHLPMQIRMELETVCQSRRLPGMPTSNVGAECILGRDETIEFEDYLGLPNDSEVGVDMRAALEQSMASARATLSRAASAVGHGSRRTGLATSPWLGPLGCKPARPGLAPTQLETCV